MANKIKSINLTGIKDTEPLKKEVNRILKKFLEVAEWKASIEKLKLPAKAWFDANAKDGKVDLVLDYDGKIVKVSAAAPNKTTSVMGIIDIEKAKAKVKAEVIMASLKECGLA